MSDTCDVARKGGWQLSANMLAVKHFTHKLKFATRGCRNHELFIKHPVSAPMKTQRITPHLWGICGINTWNQLNTTFPPCSSLWTKCATSCLSRCTNSWYSRREWMKSLSWGLSYIWTKLSSDCWSRLNSGMCRLGFAPCLWQCGWRDDCSDS